mmetsp:Transcript_71253/g.118410  ORF Transcript_71253/g.118410 Transcript_71253/m.118410 type:complete len:262 (+) Transcript_71253:149-934(+)
MRLMVARQPLQPYSQLILNHRFPCLSVVAGRLLTATVPSPGIEIMRSVSSGKVTQLFARSCARRRDNCMSTVARSLWFAAASSARGKSPSSTRLRRSPFFRRLKRNMRHLLLYSFMFSPTRARNACSIPIAFALHSLCNAPRSVGMAVTVAQVSAAALSAIAAMHSSSLLSRQIACFSPSAFHFSLEVCFIISTSTSVSPTSTSVRSRIARAVCSSLLLGAPRDSSLVEAARLKVGAADAALVVAEVWGARSAARGCLFLI